VNAVSLLQATKSLLVAVCVWFIGCSTSACQLHCNVEWRSYVRRSGRDTTERCHSVPYCLDARLRTPYENHISRRVSNWVSSKLPFRTFRPLSAYSILGFQLFMWQYYCRLSKWVSSRLPFRTFRPASAYSVLGFQVFMWRYYCVMLCSCVYDATVCYAGSYIK
jgi:hypothetical protein